MSAGAAKHSCQPMSSQAGQVETVAGFPPAADWASMTSTCCSLVDSCTSACSVSITAACHDGCSERMGSQTCASRSSKAFAASAEDADSAADSEGAAALWPAAFNAAGPSSALCARAQTSTRPVLPMHAALADSRPAPCLSDLLRVGSQLSVCPAGSHEDRCCRTPHNQGGC